MSDDNSTIPIDILIKIFHSLVDRLLDVGLPAPNYSDYSNYWSFSEWIRFTEYNTELLLRCSCSTEVVTKLREASGESSSTKALIEVLKVRQADLRRAAVNTVCKQQKSYLRDFDWQLQLVLGSDKVSSIEEPAIDVLLDINEGDNSKVQSLELNLEQMDSFIQTLEQINQEVLQNQL